LYFEGRAWRAAVATPAPLPLTELLVGTKFCIEGSDWISSVAVVNPVSSMYLRSSVMTGRAPSCSTRLMIEPVTSIRSAALAGVPIMATALPIPSAWATASATLFDLNVILVPQRWSYACCTGIYGSSLTSDV
jgi:hypothetical protein